MSDCLTCGKANGFEANGWLVLTPFESANGGCCQVCTTLLVGVWARQARAQALPPPASPTPTSPPSGDAAPALLAAVAA